MKIPKVIREHGSLNQKYLDWVRAKHQTAGADFAGKLVAALAAEFRLHPPLSDDDRARLYQRVRLRVQMDEVVRLRKLAKLPISA